MVQAILPSSAQTFSPEFRRSLQDHERNLDMICMEDAQRRQQVEIQQQLRQQQKQLDQQRRYIESMRSQIYSLPR